MIRYFLFFLLLTLIHQSYSQCNTGNATNCQCEQAGQTNCDLLPDIIVGRPPLIEQSNTGIIEYSQNGNGTNDGKLRISVSTPNIGFGPLEIHADSIFVCGTDTFYGIAPAICPNGIDYPKQLIKQRIYHKNGNAMSYYDHPAGSMTYHPTHGHMHVDNWGIYTLRTKTLNPDPLTWPVIATGSKLAFCLMDFGTCSYYNGHCINDAGDTLLNSDFPNFGLGGGVYGCSNILQGISSGYTDIYYQQLDGMWIQLPVNICNGNYYIVVQLDPNNNFIESDENNNVLAVPVLLQLQNGTLPVITPGGATTFCQGKNVTLTTQAAQSYLWSNGATTQSITVSSSGTYSVTVTSNGCTNLSSINPVNVTVTPFIANASATPPQLCGSGTVQLNSNVTSGTTTQQNVNFSNTNMYAIPDNNISGVNSPVTVSNMNPTTLQSGVVVKVKVNISHTYDSDLKLYLIAPSGQIISLCENRGGSSDNFTNTVFSMAAVTSITNGTAPFTGTFIPEGNLNAVSGNANGVWYLRAIDGAALDTGSILNWTLTLLKTINSTYSYSWSSNPSGFSSTMKQPVAPAPLTTTYFVSVSDASGCTTTASTLVTVNAIPNVSFTGLNSIYQVVEPVAALTGSPSGGTFSGNGISGNSFNPAVAGIGGPYNITYNYTDGNGCADSDTQSVSVTASTYNCGVPQNVIAVIMTATKVKIKWTTATAPQFKLRYKNLTLNTAYKTKYFSGVPGVTSYIIKNLAPSTNYRAEVQSVCNGVTTAFSSPVYFTTPALKTEYNPLEVTLSPNPASGIITINFESTANTLVDIKIFDVTGSLKNHTSTVTNNNSSGNAFNIPVSDLPAGIYFITVQLPDAISNLKFIKN